ncbi:MAG: sensor histidine kinase [Verrucomicrobiota bacterium]
MPLNLLKPLDTLTSQVHERSQLHRVAVTVSIVAVAAAARYALTPFFGDRSLWIFFYPAVLLAAWYGRLTCGLLATALSIIVANTLWVQPALRGEMAQTRPLHLSIWISLASFVAMGILISVLTETSHRAARSERRERKERERERHFFESALASSTDALVVLDHQWRIVYVNAVAVKIGRKPRDQILGKIVWECCPYLRESQFYAHIIRCREQNIPVQFDYYYATFELWTEVRAFPMGEYTAFYLLDISARKRIENDLAEAQKKLSEHAARLERTVAERTAALQETVAELERFSYTISHDLRAPLRTLESFSQFIMEDYGDKLDAHGQDLLHRIRDAARRMDALINDVLVYSRTSRAELQIEPLDLDHLTRSIVSQYSSLNFSAANIEIKSPLGRVLGNETMCLLKPFPICCTMR